MNSGFLRERRLLFLLTLIVTFAWPDSTTQAAQAKPGINGADEGRNTAELALPASFARRTGDLDQMVQRRNIRALVIYSRSGFFYVDGRPAGIFYEALRDFEQFVNKKLATRYVQVTFIPVRPNQLETALNDGIGDLIAYPLVVTPEREQRVAFTIPVQTDVKQILITGKSFGPISSLEDLGGKKVYVNPLTTYYGNLEKINESLHKQGKPPILIQSAGKRLLDEDLMEMVNAGLIPATVTNSERAGLWSQVLENISPHPDIVLGAEGRLAWAVRKDSPRLKQLLDDFIRPRAVGTSFGNTLVRRYLQSDEFVKNATSKAELEKFNATVDSFKKYAGQYGFDYLLIVAQGYQESMLEQSKRSPSGAVGIMQVKPGTAAAPPISVPDISKAEDNIHAAMKILRGISDEYFSDPAIDPVDRMLFSFASYNAGPNRIAELRKKALGSGLDPNRWFGNVEVLVAEHVGPVTVKYVSNIYKYYVAYKLVVEQGESLQ
jgi:membrane-bound lytic murein transglycosylase MltF